MAGQAIGRKTTSDIRYVCTICTLDDIAAVASSALRRIGERNNLGRSGSVLEGEETGPSCSSNEEGNAVGGRDGFLWPFRDVLPPGSGL